MWWVDPIELIQILVSFGGMLYSWAFLRDSRRDQLYIREQRLNGFMRLITAERVTISIGIMWSQIILLVQGCILTVLRAGYLPEQLEPMLEMMKRGIPVNSLTVLATLALTSSALSRLFLSVLLTGLSVYRRHIRKQLYEMHLDQQTHENSAMRTQIANHKETPSSLVEEPHHTSNGKDVP